MKVKTLAIPLRVADFSESSQVVALYTRERGRVDAIAKGAHREKGSFQGPFDLAVLYEVVLIERRAEGLAILTDGSVVDGYRGLRARLDRQQAAAHVLELLRVVATGGAADTELFDLVRATLDGIAGGDAGRVETVLARFDLRALTVLGLLGPLDSCVVCGRGWPGDRSAYISAAAGGLICSHCRATRPSPGTSLRGEAVRILGLLTEDADPWREIDAAWPTHKARILAVVTDLRDYLLEREFVAFGSSRRAGARSRGRKPLPPRRP